MLSIFKRKNELKQQRLKEEELALDLLEVKKIADKYYSNFKQAVQSKEKQSIDWPRLFQEVKNFKKEIFNYPEVCENLKIHVYEVNDDDSIILLNCAMERYTSHANSWYQLDAMNKEYAAKNLKNMGEWDTYSVALLYAMYTFVYDNMKICEKINAA